MSILNEIEVTLKSEIKQAIIKAGLAAENEIPEIQLEQPKDKAHGDFAANIAMQLARIAKKAPRMIAEDIVGNIDKEAANIKDVEIAGPGFINFFMGDAFLDNVIENVLAAGSDYGRTNTGGGKRVQVEFVSVNPTGDLHLGHARGAAYGDVLCNILDMAGFDVDREYYINDAGSQIDKLAKSVRARYLQALGQEAELPEGGYNGADIIEIGKKLAQDDGDKWIEKSEAEQIEFFKTYGLDFELGKIKDDLADFGVNFDKWFSEKSLYRDGKITKVLDALHDGGYIYESEGATWFKSSEFADDKDRVLVKNDGNYTYLTPDIAYHRDKLERGYDNIINVWGADHHGYIARMSAAIQALGYDSDVFDVKIIQMVNLFENGEKIKMSKRSGKLITLRDLMEEVGVDATRYFFVMRSNDTQLDFDMDLARSQSNDNPVYYVQYAHARICAMLRNADEQGLLADEFDATLLTDEKELDLLKKVAAFPDVVADAADKQTPQKMTQYVFELSANLHSFYNAVKVLDKENVDITHARIALMKAVKVTLAAALGLIGVNAPEKM